MCYNFIIFYCQIIYSIVWIDHILFICSSLDVPVVCFYLLTFVNNTAVNTGIQESVQVLAFRFFGYVEVEFLGHMLIILLTF